VLNCLSVNITPPRKKVLGAPHEPSQYDPEYHEQKDGYKHRCGVILVAVFHDFRAQARDCGKKFGDDHSKDGAADSEPETCHHGGDGCGQDDLKEDLPLVGYLAQERILSQQIQQQQAAAQSAQRFVDMETDRYQLGIDPYIDVVTAQNTLLSDRQTLATLHTQEMTASVQLIVALGGGWDSTQLPTPAQISQKLTPAETVIQR
jgi:Outer membrane efflux protein